jgi:hypothetical protein
MSGPWDESDDDEDELQPDITAAAWIIFCAFVLVCAVVYGLYGIFK